MPKPPRPLPGDIELPGPKHVHSREVLCLVLGAREEHHTFDEGKVHAYIHKRAGLNGGIRGRAKVRWPPIALRLPRNAIPRGVCRCGSGTQLVL